MMVTGISSTSETTSEMTQPSVERTKLSTCVIEPALFQFKDSTFEYSAYKPSSRFLKDFDTIFPNLSVKSRNQLLVIPVVQKCVNDMVGFSEVVNKERDVKLELVIIRVP